MSVENKNISFLKPGERLDGAARSGVSLHCHTLHSRELLDFVPYYAERIPVVSYFVQRDRKRCEREGITPPDLKSGFWTPPLNGSQVFEMETISLLNLGLESMVSITDHDSISANMQIRGEVPEGVAPISMEWTVPYDNAFFHVGVHNLPHERAEAITADLLDYTHAEGVPDNDRLTGLFTMLGEIDGVLVVLNHPIWDIEMIGQELHERALRRFLADHAGSIHAIEVNGFRTWSENQTAIELAESLGLPIVSGGDRHCMHSNTMFNLTDAGSFDEFVHEIRHDHKSSIAVRPEYHVPLPSRQLASIAQILGKYPHFEEGRRTWAERVYLDSDGSGIKTLAEHWNGKPPVWTTAAIWAVNLLAIPAMRPVIAALVGDKDIGREDPRANDEMMLTSIQTAAQR